MSISGSGIRPSSINSMGTVNVHNSGHANIVTTTALAALATLVVGCLIESMPLILIGGLVGIADLCYLSVTTETRRVYRGTTAEYASYVPTFFYPRREREVYIPTPIYYAAPTPPPLYSAPNSGVASTRVVSYPRVGSGFVHPTETSAYSSGVPLDSRVGSRSGSGAFSHPTERLAGGGGFGGVGSGPSRVAIL